MSWKVLPAQTETYEEYCRRREALITDRLLPRDTYSMVDNSHLKAGCFDCEALWSGDQVRVALKTHREFYPRHTTWIIDQVQ